MKLSVIGGGGVRSMFLAKSIAQRAKELGITQLVFMDKDMAKLDLYGRMAAHVSSLLCPELDFLLTTDPAEAVRDADYVITTIREGGDGMRVRDERIALSAGVLGQETTGAAGLSFAMRSVPALAEYCELVRRHAKPGAKVFNFTNPAGVVSQALRDMGYDFTYGICDAPSGMMAQFAKLYGAPAQSVETECYGLNHLSFFRRIWVEGRDVVPDLIESDEAYQRTDMRFFDKDLTRHCGCILNEYLYYFYYREKAVENILKAGVTRGEQIAKFNRLMTEELAGLDPVQDFEKCLEIFEMWYGRREDAYMASETGVKRDTPWKFDIFGPDSGGYAGVALRFMQIRQSGEAGSMVLCVPNEGAIAGLQPDDTVEVTCDITADGCRPRPMGEIDPNHMELIRRVKYYERLAAGAIVKKDRKMAVDALLYHPLVNSYSLATRLVGEYLDLNRDYVRDWR